MYVDCGVVELNCFNLLMGFYGFLNFLVFVGGGKKYILGLNFFFGEVG